MSQTIAACADWTVVISDDQQVEIRYEHALRASTWPGAVKPGMTLQYLGFPKVNEVYWAVWDAADSTAPLVEFHSATASPHSFHCQGVTTLREV